MATPLPPDGSKEALEEALKKVPSDKAMDLTPDIQARFASFAKLVYPYVDATSNQYREMEMIWHVAYLDLMDVLTDVVGEVDDEEVGTEILHYIMTQVKTFLEDYKQRRAQQPKEEK